jgi:cell division GTPase FtsZ
MIFLTAGMGGGQEQVPHLFSKNSKELESTYCSRRHFPFTFEGPKE